jgi:3-deoxy-D-arabino-heptulosonate 7-phosphate (DAHP) synthase
MSGDDYTKKMPETIEHLENLENAEKKRVVDKAEDDVDEDEEYTVKEQRKIIHKVDRRLLVVLGLMQAVSFLDRANISNAEIAR